MTCVARSILIFVHWLYLLIVPIDQKNKSLQTQINKVPSLGAVVSIFRHYLTLLIFVSTSPTIARTVVRGGDAY